MKTQTIHFRPDAVGAYPVTRFIGYQLRGRGQAGRRVRRCSKQSGKAFLREMIIVRQDFGDALLPHGFHRNAVGETIFLIRPGFVEGQAGNEGLSALRQHENRRVGHHAVRLQGGDGPKLAGMAESGEKFAQNLIRSHNLDLPEGTAQFQGGGVVLIPGVGKGDPIERIGKDAPHAVGRFGVP
jgi:hypothetical protein